MVLRLPKVIGPLASAWHAIFDICEAATASEPWTLVGGQMVFLHAVEYGVDLARPTIDADVLVDVKVAPRSTRAMTQVLQGLGFELEVSSAAGGAHRFRRGDATVDLLAPDNLGQRATLLTVPPGTTVQTPGGGHALARTVKVEVLHAKRRALVPRPDLLGAVLIKSAAVARLPQDAGHERHAQDLALLLSLVQDPFELRHELSLGQRRLLNQTRNRLPKDGRAWSAAIDPDAAFLALQVLAASPER